MNPYASLINVPGHGTHGQEILRQAHALVIGAGGLGCPVSTTLVHSGFGAVTIVDNDLVEVSNLSRQFLYGVSDIGKSKVNVALEKLQSSNIESRLNVLNEDARSIDLSEYSIIFDCSDNFETKSYISEMARKLGTHCVTGSIYRFTAQVYAFNNQTSKRYCLTDIFSGFQGNNSCSLVGVYGSHCMMTGALMAQEGIRLIINTDRYPSRLILLDSQNYRLKSFDMKQISVEGHTDPIQETKLKYLDSVPTLDRNEAANVGYTIYDVRTAKEYLEMPSDYENIPLAHIINDPDPTRYNDCAFICASGYRAKLCAYHINSKLQKDGAIAII